MNTKLAASPKHLLIRSSSNLEDYCTDLMEISAGRELFRFSKSEFYRFRDLHRIETLPGNRIHLLDIVGALQAERGIAEHDRTCIDARGYAALLLTRSEAETKMKMSRRTFCRFRRKHKVPTLSGGFVHAEDLIAAMDADRRGGPAK